MEPTVSEQIGKGFDDLKGLLASAKAASEAELKAINERIEAQNKAIQEKVKGTEEWLSKVQAQMNTARTHGPGTRDALVDAIPKEYRHWIERAERMDRRNPDGSKKDPAKDVSMGLWWHLKYMETLARGGQRTGKSSAEYEKMADDLERAWGYDPEDKARLAAVLRVAGESTALAGGQNIIATPVEAELLRLIRDNTVVRPFATKIAMTAVTHQIPTEGTNITAFIVPENTVITDSLATATQFTQIGLTAKMFAGLATLSNQLLQDNIIGINDYLFTAIGEAIGILEDQGALDGTNFTGIAVATSVNSLSTSGNTSGGDNPTYNDIVSTIYKASHRVSRLNAMFFMHPFVVKNIVGLIDTNGQPIFKFGTVQEALMGAPRAQILGYPVQEVSSLSITQTDKTQSTSRVYFGPPAKILYGDLSGMDFMIDPYGKMDSVLTRVRVTKRTAIVVPVGSYYTVLKGSQGR